MRYKKDSNKIRTKYGALTNGMTSPVKSLISIKSEQSYEECFPERDYRIIPLRFQLADNWCWNLTQDIIEAILSKIDEI